MTENLLLFLIGQAVLIVGAIIATHVSMRTQLARVEATLEQMVTSLDHLRQDHNRLKVKVDGISRNVALLEGMELARKEGIGANQL